MIFVPFCTSRNHDCQVCVCQAHLPKTSRCAVDICWWSWTAIGCFMQKNCRGARATPSLVRHRWPPSSRFPRTPILARQWLNGCRFKRSKGRSKKELTLGLELSILLRVSWRNYLNFTSWVWLLSGAAPALSGEGGCNLQRCPRPEAQGPFASNSADPVGFAPTREVRQAESQQLAGRPDLASSSLAWESPKMSQDAKWLHATSCRRPSHCDVASCSHVLVQKPAQTVEWKCQPEVTQEPILSTPEIDPGLQWEFLRVRAPVPLGEPLLEHVFFPIFDRFFLIFIDDEWWLVLITQRSIYFGIPKEMSRRTVLQYRPSCWSFSYHFLS